MYNEYIASEGNVLLNVVTFTYGNRILSKYDISGNLIETTKEIALEYIEKYNNSNEEINSEYDSKLKEINDVKLEQEKLGIMTLGIEDSIDSLNEDKENKLNIVRANLYAEIKTKGYIKNNNVQSIKHE